MKHLSIYSIFIITVFYIISCDGPSPPIEPEPLPDFTRDEYRIGYWLRLDSQIIDTLQFLDESHSVFRGNSISSVYDYEIANDTLILKEPGHPFPTQLPYSFSQEEETLTLYFKNSISPGRSPVNFKKLW